MEDSAHCACHSAAWTLHAEQQPEEADGGRAIEQLRGDEHYDGGDQSDPYAAKQYPGRTDSGRCGRFMIFELIRGISSSREAVRSHR